MIAMNLSHQIHRGDHLNQSIDDILGLAISFESESFVFYNGLKDTIENKALHGILEELATAEIAHKEKLEELQKNWKNEGAGVFIDLEEKEVEDMKLSDFLVPIKISSDASFQDILIKAMHREAKAHEFYENMKTITASEEVLKLFSFLSAEELDHKNIIEKLYDDEVYKEF